MSLVDNIKRRLRLALVSVAGLLIVVIDSFSYVLSACSDLVLTAIVLALVWGPLKRDSEAAD